jgi:signal transduction histidine kinase
VSTLLGFERGEVFLWDADSDSIEVLREHQHTDQSSALAKDAIRANKVISQAGWLAVPLAYQEHCIGAIVADDKGSQRRIDPERAVLLQFFAEQVAPAVAMARLNTIQLRQRDLLQAIIGSTPDPVLVVNRDGRITRTNPAAVTLFNTEAMQQDVVELLTAHATTVVPSAHDEMYTAFQKSPADLLREALGQDQPFSQEISTEAGRFSLLAAPLRTAGTATLQTNEAGWVILLHDITALKNLDELRTRMLRMASHDLKNPLSVIKGYAELMLEEDRDPVQHKMLSHILNSSNRMFALIGELLDSDRARLGQLKLLRLNLKSLVEATATEFKIQIEDKKQVLTIKLADSALWVMGDEPQLHEAIGNLISNAIKYTPEGGSITVAALGQQRKVQIMVIDTGIGIPKESQQNLFQPYYRVKSEATANITGTGLGLSIVKGVVDSHGGRIWIESEEGKGSKFFIELPLVDAQAEISAVAIVTN